MVNGKGVSREFDRICAVTVKAQDDLPDKGEHLHWVRVIPSDLIDIFTSKGQLLLNS